MQSTNKTAKQTT